MNTSLPRVSVVIPAFNSERTLPATLAALAAQTAPAGEFEVIVVDDGSRDASGAVAARAGAAVIRQENKGPAAARNAGARAARGEILVFTDDDCRPTPSWLEEMLRPFADPSVAGVQGAYRTEQRQIAARFAQLEFEDRYDLQTRGRTIELVATYAAAYRREVFLAMGLFDEGFTRANNEDTEFSYRLSRAGHRLVFAPAAIVLHQHPDSLRRYLTIKFKRAYWRMAVYRDYPGKAVSDGYTPQVVKLQTVLGLGFFLGLPATFSVSVFALTSPACLACILLSALPFSRKAFAKDRLVGFVSPGIVALRSLVFALGTACGGLRFFRSGPKRPPG